MLLILIYVLYKLYKSKLLTLRTIRYSCINRMSIVIGPKGLFNSCDDILDCLGQVYAGTVFGYSSLYKGDSTRFSEVALGNPTYTCIPRVDG